jgi:hypothetical protein
LSSVPRFEAIASLLIGGVVAIFVSPGFGAVIWAVGAVITLSEARHDARLDERFQKVDRLAEVFDLSESCEVDELGSLISNYLAIPEPELARVKNSVIATARDDLSRLATEKSSGELPSGEYYSWLLPMLGKARQGAVIRALSMMMDCEWDDSEPERRFIQENIDAAERGVVVERVFVSTSAVMLQAIEKMPAVRPQLAFQQPSNLKGFFVDHSYLERSDAGLLKKLGDGFIDIDGRVALVDLHSIDGSARGEVTMRQAELSKLRDIHDQLLVHARVLNESLITDLRANVSNPVQKL